MPYALEAAPADMLRFVAHPFRVDPGAGRAGLATITFETESDLDKFCRLLKQARISFNRLGYRSRLAAPVDKQGE